MRGSGTVRAETRAGTGADLDADAGAAVAVAVDPERPHKSHKTQAPPVCTLNAERRAARATPGSGCTPETAVSTEAARG
ncbi:hypothetical protein GCM10010519_42200 [Streptomyces lactacystinicus]